MRSDPQIDFLWRPSQWYNAFYFIAGGLVLVMGIVVALKGLVLASPGRKRCYTAFWLAD